MPYLGKISRVFDYVMTRTDEYVIYDVYYGDRAPLNGGTDPVHIGRVRRLRNHSCDWHAALRDGPWSESKWLGTFFTRAEATLFLAGYYIGPIMEPDETVLQSA